MPGIRRFLKRILEKRKHKDQTKGSELMSNPEYTPRSKTEEYTPIKGGGNQLAKVAR